MEKLQKFSKAALRVIQVMTVLTIAAAACCLVGIAVLLALGERIPFTSLTLGCLSFTVASGHGLEVSSGSYMLIMAGSLFALSMALIILQLLKKILRPMTEGKPFAAPVAPTIKKIAWIYLIGDGIFQVLVHAICYSQFYQLKLYELLGGDIITEVRYQADFSLNSLFVFGILLLLSLVFRYGQQLQQLSDETV